MSYSVSIAKVNLDLFNRYGHYHRHYLGHLLFLHPCRSRLGLHAVKRLCHSSFVPCSHLLGASTEAAIKRISNITSFIKRRPLRVWDTVQSFTWTKSGTGDYLLASIVCQSTNYLLGASRKWIFAFDVTQ